MKKSIRIFGYSSSGPGPMAFGIETDVRSGFPGFEIIGLADSAIKESRERVKTALRNCGFKFPQQHVLVSLSPADLPKSGSLLDLGICLGILFATAKDSVEPVETVNVMTAGELSLDGSVVADNSALGAVDISLKLKCPVCLIPLESDAPNVITVKNLTQAFIKCGEILNSDAQLSIPEVVVKRKQPVFEDIIGLDYEKKIIAMAASGYHSLLMFGPPGVGKSLLSSRIRYLLPELSSEERRSVLQIHSYEDCPEDVISNGVSCMVPHDCNVAAFNNGNGQRSKGYAPLAHRGTLILDELNKYTPSLLESVKDAYDRGFTLSSRNGGAMVPCRFMLVANMNACSCCGLGSRVMPCTCTSLKLENHWRRVGHALLDRFDVRLPISEIDFTKAWAKPCEDDSWYSDRIRISADRQRHRFKDSGISFNGEIRLASSPLSLLRKECEVMSRISEMSNMNARARIEVLALARTIADFEDRELLNEEDLFIALGLRRYGSNGDYYWRVLNG